MTETILSIGMADAPVPQTATLLRLDQAGLEAMLADAAAPEPAVVVLGPDLAQPLPLARAVRQRWQLCELIFAPAPAHYSALRVLLGRAPLIGAHWSAIQAHDGSLAAIIDDGVRNAARRARLRTTLDKANVRLAAPRRVHAGQYRRLAIAGHYLDNFLAQTPDGIVGLDPALQVIQWNESASRQWNLPRRNALSMHAPALPFWNAPLAASVQRALAGAPTVQVESDYARDGATVHMEMAVSGVRGDGGTVIGVSLVIRDTTERQRRLDRERLLVAGRAAQTEEQRRRLFDMFKLAPGFIAITRGPLHVLDMANDAYAALFGARVHEHLPIAHTFPELGEQPFVSLRDSVYATGLPYVGKACPVVTRADDGTLRERVIDFVYQPWHDDDGQVAGIFCQGHDVTEQKQMQDGLLTHQAELEQLVSQRTEDLRAANLALQQSQKLEAIGQLTGGVAHDFNNILQVIGSNLDLMRMDQHLSDALRARVDSSTAAVERAARLSAQLLAFARRQPLQPVPTNIGGTVRDLDDILSRALGEAVDVVVNTGANLWNSLVDRHQLENVILNLAINARDAMGAAGKLTIDLDNVELDAGYVAAHPELSAGQYVRMALSDTGSGMSAEVLQRVFEPFFTTKREGEGSGLGLSMAYGFVKQSGGHITIYSEAGNGTTVRIYLPRCHDSEFPMAKPSVEEAPGGNETVLVVEDDVAVRIAVVDTLKGLGYNVVNACDAGAALAMLEAGARPDLLFTDVVMPGTLRSPELARQARRLVPGIAILFTSGYTQNAIVHAGRLDAGVELLSKPYRRADLARKMREVLDAARRQAPGRRRVVVVEDNDDARDMLAQLLELLGHATLCFGAAAGVLEALDDDDILLTDVTLPGESGLALAERACARHPGLRVIFSTGRYLDPGTVPGKVLLKPFTFDQLTAILAQCQG